MAPFRVTTYVTVDAEDSREAALKAFMLHHEMTPVEYEVLQLDAFDNEDVDVFSDEFVLDEDDRNEALKFKRQGELFPSTVTCGPA